MKRAILRISMCVVVVCVLTVANIASADLVQGIDIDFVTIGNPGNPADTQVMITDGTTGYGAVDYTYQIGKYEVTNGQWDAFISAAGAPTGNPSNAYNSSAYWTGTDIPTNEVSWYETAQFCNYLTTGDKSVGVYQFSGNNTNPGDFEGIDRDSAISTYGMVYVIPTENEWYKAAYYTGSGYSTYANGTDTAPVLDVDTNYYSGGHGAYSIPWDVGTGTMEQNGTFDMMGNVFEWNEALIAFYRGGSYRGTYVDNIRSSYRSNSVYPSDEWMSIGFRVASVSEPAIIQVSVDVKPGSCPNPLRVNFKGNGVLPVAITGSEDFDVLTIDVDTITLEGVAPLRSKVGDVSTFAGGESCECTALGPDGIPDLTLKFSREAILDALEASVGDLGVIPNREELVLTLLARTVEGTLVTGTDCLRILNRGAIKRKK